MSEPFIAEIRCFGFNFAPRSWAFCNGQLMSVAQNTALFSLVGTTYGGDGVQTFGLPNLQGQIPMHWGTSPGFNTVYGEVQGTPSVTLTVNQIPQHNHTLKTGQGTAAERTASPNAQSYLSSSQPPNQAWKLAPSSVTAAFSAKAISQAGGSQPHDNMQPFLTLNFCIALEGLYPSRN